ncbi:MAG: aspartate dehydrogenase [Nitrospinota bacterium]|nr:MAG: aspartate dehydrogenase [Nitrospinota bacterium]
MSLGQNPLRIAIAGLGAIGLPVARRLDAGIPGLELRAVAVRDVAKAERHLASFTHPVSIVTLPELAQQADVVVECLPAAVFPQVAFPAVQAGRVFVPLSVGALLAYPELPEMAIRHGARIIVPSGAILGLDAVRAAAEGEIRSVKITTRKPPASLAGAPYLVQHGITIENLQAPLKVFEGSAREGAQGFPANVNVAAALSLAGIGPDRTRLEIWADPHLTRNTHHIEVEADSARFSMTMEGLPSPENPRTGRLVAQSVIATLRGLVSPIRIGT